MAAARELTEQALMGLARRGRRPTPNNSALGLSSYSARAARRAFSVRPVLAAQGTGSSIFGLGSSMGQPSSYFQRQSLPANTIVRFVPQQTAWIVERMGRFNRILEPGLAILMPVLDRIAYVKSLKEAAIEIPSQSAITADNVTLELDGVLYTRVFDAYKARYALRSIQLYLLVSSLTLLARQLRGRGCRVCNFSIGANNDAFGNRPIVT